jgi:hypothetical protein
VEDEYLGVTSVQGKQEGIDLLLRIVRSNIVYAPVKRYQFALIGDGTELSSMSPCARAEDR